MNDLVAWQKNNDEFLADAVHWVRLRLQRLIDDQAGEPTEPSVPRRGFWAWLFGDSDRRKPKPKKRGGSADKEIEHALAAMKRSAAADPPPALAILRRRLGLGDYEENLLLLCAAMELDTRVADLCARAQADPSRAHPTFALAMTLFDEPVWDAMSPERPLRYWRLLEINQPGAQPLTTSALRIDERVVSYLKGLNYLDDRLTALLKPIEETPGPLPLSHQRQVDRIVGRLRAAANGPPLIQLVGSDSASKRLVAAGVGKALRLNVYRLDTEIFPTAWGELESLARLYQRESQLLPLALYLDCHTSDKERVAVNRFLDRNQGAVFLDTRETWADLGRETLVLDVSKPSAAEQEAAWRNRLGEAAGETPALLAGQFNFNLMEIDKAVEASEGEGGSSEENLWRACLSSSRPRLDTLAQRIELKAQAWDDLVLPAAEKNLLRQVTDQVAQRHVVYERGGFARRMSRGLGISALFAGESGTGKTLAAEVMAGELKLSLYRIDLSQVVSKYIGETEKNLRKLFDAAEDGGTILFFDEADALFGKRSEVKDSHDRYANIEINYLLQRMEAYRGLAILATNRKSSLDPAFVRRLRFIVNFPFPGVAERRAIWMRIFPKETSTPGLDFDYLARFNLTGGSIQNVAVNAAFLAASRGSPVTMAVVLEAARGEFRKLEKPVNEADFRMIAAVDANA